MVVFEGFELEELNCDEFFNGLIMLFCSIAIVLLLLLFVADWPAFDKLLGFKVLFGLYSYLDASTVVAAPIAKIKPKCRTAIFPMFLIILLPIPFL